ncbi:hypothetical protein ACOSQ2_004264 [Xanthoceras sorbifolium]
MSSAPGTISETTKKQLIVLEIFFSAVQFIIAFVCLIVKANYNSSVFPLVYAAIAVWFSFINSTEEEISNTTQTVFGNEKNTDPLQQIVISSDNPTSNFVLKNQTGEIRGQPITLRQRKPILPLFEVQEEWNVKLRSISEPNIMPPHNCTTTKVQTSNYLS